MDGGKLLGYADALDAAAQSDLFASPVGEVIKREMTMLASHYEPVFARYEKTLAGIEKVGAKYVPLCDQLVGVCRVVKFAAARTYAEAKGDIAALSAPDLPRGVPSDAHTDESLAFRDHRAAFKKAFDKLKSDFFCFADGEIADSLRRSAALDRALARVCFEYEKRFGELKRERGAVDFGDLERFAHRLFVGENGEPHIRDPESAEDKDRRFRDKGESDVLLDDPYCLFRSLYRLGYFCRIVVHQYDVGGFDGGVGA